MKLGQNSGSVVFFEELAPDIKSPSKVTEGSLWQADHVVPVWRGGGLCGLENLQTLCTACHSAKTKAEARERKEDPKGEFWLASFLDKVSVGDNEKNGIYVQTCPFYRIPRRKTLDHNIALKHGGFQ